MAIIIERLSRWHVGYHRGKATGPAGSARELHLGIIAIVWFRGSLRVMLMQWQQLADVAVQERAQRWIAAETIATEKKKDDR
jgi:hypothetical protein